LWPVADATAGDRGGRAITAMLSERQRRSVGIRLDRLLGQAEMMANLLASTPPFVLVAAVGGRGRWAPLLDEKGHPKRWPLLMLNEPTGT
jgi:hypothetical protein